MVDNQDQIGVLTHRVRLNAHAKFATLHLATAINRHSPARARHLAAVFEVGASAFYRMPRPYAQ